MDLENERKVNFWTTFFYTGEDCVAACRLIFLDVMLAIAHFSLEIQTIKKYSIVSSLLYVT